MGLDSGTGLSLRGHPRKSQQILNQLLHAGSTIHGIVDKLPGILIQFVRVTPCQKLRKTRHHSKRLLKVMRCHISKLLKLLVGALKLLTNPFQTRLYKSALRDIHSGSDQQFLVIYRYIQPGQVIGRLLPASRNQFRLYKIFSRDENILNFGSNPVLILA